MCPAYITYLVDSAGLRLITSGAWRVTIIPTFCSGDEVNHRPFLGVEIYYVQVANSFDPLEM